MTAIQPIHQVTTGPFTVPTRLIAAPLLATGRRRAAGPASEVPGWAQLGAAITAAGLAWFAVVLAGSWLWAALPLAVLGTAIFAGAVLPDVIGAHWDRRRASAEEASS